MSLIENVETVVIGTSSVIKEKLRFIEKVAKSEKNVLILGETGTGKELVAKKIHELSHRKYYPYVAINCASIPEDLFEAELSGFVRGSFTGAFKDKPGLLEVAKEGTIFLDEIGELSFNLQAKILRIIDRKESRRIGETITRKIAARIIFATNKDLQKEVRNGKFRKDLYYRINVLNFFIPPLRERKEDIPLLVNYILKKEKIIEKKISNCALKKLMEYDFPGNIRELENIVERACILSEGDILTGKDIKFDSELSAFKRGFEITPEQLRRTLENCRWNKTTAASKIGRSRRQFYRLLEKYKMVDCLRKTYF